MNSDQSEIRTGNEPQVPPLVNALPHSNPHDVLLHLPRQAGRRRWFAWGTLLAVALSLPTMFALVMQALGLERLLADPWTSRGILWVIAVDFPSLAIGLSLFNRIEACPVRFHCPDCGKHLSSEIPWACGYCDAINAVPLTAFAFSFLHKCRWCRNRPKAFACVHCGKLIYFDAGRDGRHAAGKVPVNPPPEQACSPETQSAISGLLGKVTSHQAKVAALCRWEIDQENDIRAMKGISEDRRQLLLDELKIAMEDARLEL